MSLHSVALLRISYSTLCELRGIAPVSSYRLALEETKPFAPLGSDGAAFFLDVELGAPPADVSALIRGLLGDTLDIHEDCRGVFIAPDLGWPEEGFDSYDEAIQFFGESGEWAPILSGERAHALALERIKGTLDGDVTGGALDHLGAMEGLFARNPQILHAATSAVQRHLADAIPDGTDPSALTGGALVDIAQQMFSRMSPQEQSQLEQMAKSLFGQLTAPDDPDEG